MADTATEQTVVAAPLERCYRVAADFESYPQWAADVKEVTVDERDEQGKPLVVTYRAAAFGRSTSYTLSYNYGQAPQVLSWVQTKGDLTTKLDGRYEFEQIGDQETQVTYHLEVELKVPIPGFVKRRAETRIRQTALRELRARVESTT
ncbi:MAG: SRPBCC family protein [Actinobacteria bacterium]|nr:SRPBCC family protein [Actinomycetota bacterium]